MSDSNSRVFTGAQLNYILVFLFPKFSMYRGFPLVSVGVRVYTFCCLKLELKNLRGLFWQRVCHCFIHQSKKGESQTLTLPFILMFLLTSKVLSTLLDIPTKNEIGGSLRGAGCCHDEARVSFQCSEPSFQVRGGIVERAFYPCLSA